MWLWIAYAWNLKSSGLFNLPSWFSAGAPACLAVWRVSAPHRGVRIQWFSVTANISQTAGGAPSFPGRTCSGQRYWCQSCNLFRTLKITFFQKETPLVECWKLCNLVSCGTMQSSAVPVADMVSSSTTVSGGISRCIPSTAVGGWVWG